MDYIKISLIGLVAVIAYYLLLQWPPSSIEVPINQITSQENLVTSQEPAETIILKEEVFGPVAPVVPFKDEQKAIELANATEYGLVSYLYTKDLARGMAISEQLESGMVGLNRGLVSDPAAPFGGTKQSGLGREGSYEGMMEYMEKKYIAVEW